MLRVVVHGKLISAGNKIYSVRRFQYSFLLSTTVNKTRFYVFAYSRRESFLSRKQPQVLLYFHENLQVHLKRARATRERSDAYSGKAKENGGNRKNRCDFPLCIARKLVSSHSSMSCLTDRFLHVQILTENWQKKKEERRIIARSSENTITQKAQHNKNLLKFSYTTERRRKKIAKRKE